MKPGDHMILNQPDLPGQAEVVVVDPFDGDCSSGGRHVFVACACGSYVTVHESDLRPVPRVRTDLQGRIALHVVEDQ